VDDFGDLGQVLFILDDFVEAHHAQVAGQTFLKRRFVVLDPRSKHRVVEFKFSLHERLKQLLLKDRHWFAPKWDDALVKE